MGGAGGGSQNLPDPFRAAFVLCHLEGRTNEEASRILACPLGTVLSRLSRARDRLRQALTRRGVTPAAALAVAASTAIPEHLTASTGVSARAVQLAQEVLLTMRLVTLTRAGALALVLTLVGTGVGLLHPPGTGPRGNEVRA